MRRYLSYQKINGAVAATGLTVPAGATGAIIRVATQACRYRFDGVDPTGTVGNVIAAAGEITLYGKHALDNFKIIQSAATAVIHVQYFYQPSNNNGNHRVYLGYGQRATMSASIALPTIPDNATGAILRATGQGFLWRVDGDPTATDGKLEAVNTDVVIHGRENLAAMKVIEAAASAVLNVQYFRQ